MTYPTPPGSRIAYDLDGSVAFVSGVYGSPGMVGVHQTFLRAMNSDSPRMGVVPVRSSSTASLVYGSSALDLPPDHRLAIRFPQATRLRAVGISTLWGVYGPHLILDRRVLQSYVETSSDSTNGVDGTWHALLTNENNASFPTISSTEGGASEVYGYALAVSGETGSSQIHFPLVTENFRREGTPGWISVSGLASRQVTWLRIRPYGLSPNSISSTSASSNLLTSPRAAGYKLHLYGEPDTAAEQDRLALVTPSGGDLSSLDWGDVGQGLTYTKSFRIKNLSSSLAAATVLVAIQSPSPSLPALPQEWLSLSSDGVNWGSSVTLASIPPGSSSDPITLRLQVGESLIGPCGPRLFVSVGGWS